MKISMIRCAKESGEDSVRPACIGGRSRPASARHESTVGALKVLVFLPEPASCSLTYDCLIPRFVLVFKTLARFCTDPNSAC
jgi:hypothetical protein